MSKAVKVDKNYVEKVVKEDLNRKYPDITELEFEAVLSFMQYKVWVAVGTLTLRGVRKTFMYLIDSETGEILGYVIR